MVDSQGSSPRVRGSRADLKKCVVVLLVYLLQIHPTDKCVVNAASGGLRIIWIQLVVHCFPFLEDVFYWLNFPGSR